MKAIRLAVAGTMLIGAAGFTAVQSANASDACGAGHACLYGNDDFVWKISERTPNAPLMNLQGATNDAMDSWMNRSTVHAAGYEHAGGKGFCISFWWGEKDNNVNFTNSDEISSWKTNGHC